MKRKTIFFTGILLILFLVSLLTVSLVSASWFGDFFGKITGKVVGDENWINGFNSQTGEVRDGGIIPSTYEGEIKCEHYPCSFTLNGISIGFADATSEGQVNNVRAVLSSNVPEVYTIYYALSSENYAVWRNTSVPCADCTFFPGDYNGDGVSDVVGIEGQTREPEVICTDTDGGKDYFTKGNATIAGVSEKEDYCHDVFGEKELIEYYCEDDQIKEESYSCPTNFECIDGACKSNNIVSCTDTDGGNDYFTRGEVDLLGQSGETAKLEDYCKFSLDSSVQTLVEYSCNGNNPSSEEYQCNYKCDDGACMAAALTSCIDTDGGKDYYTSGITYIKSSDGSILQQNADECGVAGLLYEYYCEGNDIKLTPYTCQDSTCIDGACVAAASATCTDTDNGKDYYTKGTTTMTYPDGSIKQNTDECGMFGLLYEYVCEEGNIKLTTYKCPNGCKEGACKSSSSALSVSGQESDNQRKIYYALSPNFAFNNINISFCPDCMLLPVSGDYDGDKKADFVAYNQSGTLYYLLSSQEYSVLGSSETQCKNCKITLGDYNGDTVSDFAGEDNFGIIHYALSPNYEWGLTNSIGGKSCIFFPGDFNADGVSDIVKYCPDSNKIYYAVSPDFGWNSIDSNPCDGCTALPISGNFDGDSKSDLVAYNPQNGKIFYSLSSNNYGAWNSIDTPCMNCTAIPGDYDGDGKSDVVLYGSSL